MNSSLFNLNKAKDISSNQSSTNDNFNTLKMSDETFKNLRDIIYELSGIYFTESKRYLLEGRIAKRVTARNLKTFEEYIRFIKSPFAKQELNYLFEAITINETYFFRAEQQFEALEKVLIPEILKERTAITPTTTFRIWSAASSSGEEAYTIAMIIKEKIQPQFPRVQFQIVGSDINTKVIEDAKKGIYKEYAVRNIPPNYLNQYFKKEGNLFILDDSIKRMARFVQINLFDPMQVKTMSNCDIIFCANVLIYFDLPSKQKVVQNLYNALNKGGYLFIGYSESLHGISQAFKLVHLSKAMAYKKE